MESVDKVKMPNDTSSLQLQLQLEAPATATPVRKTFLVSSISAGIQFGWALQLSLLTPYVQLLGIPHKWASFIWLCGPISGMLVTPLVGYHSDRCTSRFGRRRPFIASGAALVTVSVFLIGFAADLGHRFGDAADSIPKPRAIVIFVIGFWFLDVANNMLQAPLRALLADLSGGDQKKTSTANALYSFFIAVGNVLGYSAGAYTRLYRIFPFTRTDACDVYCANLKSCFFISVALLVSLTTLALSLVRETPLSGGESEPESSPAEEKVPFLGELAAAFRGLQRPMLILMVVTCLNWIAWFPFFLFDTDWMGKEVFGGKVGEGTMYAQGVRVGSLGLMLNSVVIGVSSLGIGFVAKKIGGVKRLWGIVNFVLAICLGLTVVVTKLAESTRRYGGDGEPLPPPLGVKVGAVLLFSVLGIPLAVTYSVPFALASIFSNATGAGQGLSLGVLNLAIVIPQMVVSVAAGPWDDLFGGGNLPGFVVGAIAAAASGLLSLTMLPSPPPQPQAAHKLSTSAAAAAAAFH